jgi:hypothetical protein
LTNLKIMNMPRRCFLIIVQVHDEARAWNFLKNPTRLLR